MSEQNKRVAILGGVAAVLACVAGYMLFFRKEDTSIPESSGKTIYYTGPMKSKGGGGGYGTIDGKSMTAEEGKAAADKWLQEHPELNTGAEGSSSAPSGPPQVD